MSTVQRWGIPVLVAIAWLALGLPAEQVRAQSQRQSRSSTSCPQSGSPSQLSSLQSNLQNTLQQLNALQQSGQLTTSQLQAVSQLQSALQNVLQQLGTSPNGNLTLPQVQALRQQQGLQALPQRAALRGRR